MDATMESVFGESAYEFLGCEWQEVVDEAKQDLSKGAVDDADMADINDDSCIDVEDEKVSVFFFRDCERAQLH